MRAVIYARYSSDLQRDASIDDQLRICKDYIARQQGWELAQVYRDAAMSGASTLRPAYQALLETVRGAECDVIVVEALDRLSRDQEDIAALFKRCQFAGVRIVSLAEGDITELQIGLKGTMNALFLKDLGLKTHRGMRGRAEAGKSASGISFGYRAVKAFEANGDPLRGEREIAPGEAAIVNRIFQLFADGLSPIAIAKLLNAENIKGPSGRAWRDTTIRGHAARGTGILRNELYIGRQIWNRMHFRRDPATGKRVSRLNPASMWVTQTVPALQIVDDALWHRVQSRLGQIRDQSGADKPDRPKFWEERRSKHLLSGKAICGVCGGAYSAVGANSLACNAARRQGVCSNTLGIRRPQLEAIVLDALRSRLMQPEQVKLFVSEFTAEFNRLQAETAASAGMVQRELAAVIRKHAGVIDAIAEGLRGAGLQQKLDDLEAQKAELERRVASTALPTTRLHPNLASVYHEKVSAIHAALQGRGDSVVMLETARGLIEQVILRPDPRGKGLEIEFIGDIAAMIELTQTRNQGPIEAYDRDLFRRSIKVVAGIRFELMTFRL